MRSILSVLILFTSCASGQYKGEKCNLTTSGEPGTCSLLKDCPYAIGLLRNNKIPQNCGFDQTSPIVCCPNFKLTLLSLVSSGISDLKCDEYSGRKNKFVARRFVSRGTLTQPMEFPHMAVIGYEERDNIRWLCGGTLISGTYILTAAHCASSIQFGDAKWVRLGDLNLSTHQDDAQPQTIEINQIIVYPEYKRPSHYHDIALIQLKNPAIFTAYVKPACLYQEKDVDGSLIVTGWGKTDFAGETSNHLLKANLEQISFENCAKNFSNVSSRRLSNGILDEIQICAGNQNGQDTCEGDSGGPLQIPKGVGNHYFMIVGVTSFGKPCGIDNTVGVYVRVFPYLPWIEQIVWPSN